MAKLRDIREYHFFGDIDIEKTANLHRLAGNYRERILGDNLLQDVLLNDSYEFEDDERPKTFHAIGDPTINRLKTSIHLNYLEYVVDLVTRPRILAVRAPRIIIPGKRDEPRIETAEGYDAEKVEDLQEQWLRTPKVRDMVEAYSMILNEAFDEYNLKCILLKMHGCLIRRDDVDEQEIHKIYDDIEKHMNDKSYVALDDAYYRMGNRLFSGAGDVWNRLRADNFGRNFALTEKEVAEAFKNARG